MFIVSILVAEAKLAELVSFGIEALIELTRNLGKDGMYISFSLCFQLTAMMKIPLLLLKI
jgi:hypothetical protein